jgi:hypothetical protein
MHFKLLCIYLFLGDGNGLLEDDPSDTLVAGRGGERTQVSPVAETVCGCKKIISINEELAMTER